MFTRYKPRTRSILDKGNNVYKDIKVREKAFLVIRSQSIRPKHEVHTEKCPGTKLERKVGRRSGRGPSAELGIGLALCNDGAEA